ncbi:hypothetical protein NC651_009435 [Populus alba x Populus x berolinensis]|nr:hypothetical protein NC651_009435 [Populus alba x Populus x berolinensis]
MELGQISLCLAMKNEQPYFSICSNSDHQLHYHLLRCYLLKLFVVFATLCGLRISGMINLSISSTFSKDMVPTAYTSFSFENISQYIWELA